MQRFAESLAARAYYFEPFCRNLHKSFTAFCSLIGVVPKTTVSPL